MWLESEGVSFVGADLTGPTCREQLVGARFDNATLVGVQLNSANLSGSSFFGANLEGATFESRTEPYRCGIYEAYRSMNPPGQTSRGRHNRFQISNARFMPDEEPPEIDNPCPKPIRPALRTWWASD